MAEKEYIEREAAMRHLLIHCVSRYPVSFYVGLSAAAEEIKAIPAADVVEVRHGEWTKKGDDVCYWYECSICGQFPPKDHWGYEYHSAHCPSCGAKMDGDGNGT